MAEHTEINFRTLVYEIDMGIFICDPDGSFIYGNLSLAKIMGFTKAESIIGKKIRDFFAPDQGKAFNDRLLKSILVAKGQEMLRTKIIKPDDTFAFIEIRFMPFIQNGILVGSQGAIIDVTEQKQAEERAEYLSTQDPLTGLFNRNFFEAEMSRLERGRQFPISIVLVSLETQRDEGSTGNSDLDDRQIKRFARMLFQSYRGDDIVARTEDSEFAILLPGVDTSTAKSIVSRIERNLHTLIESEKGEPLMFYMVSNTGESSDSLQAVYLRAKELMFLEKKKGNTP